MELHKSNGVIVYEKNDAFSRIEKFMGANESGVVLSATEEKMLDRWIYAKGLLTEKKYTRSEIEEKIKIKFGVSIYTSRNDINNTYRLFVKVTKEYKQFGLERHIEFLEKTLRSMETDKSLKHLIPKIAAEITRAYAALPIDVDAPDVQTPVININVTASIVPKMNISDALSEADKLITFEKEHEYLEFEEKPHEPDKL